MTITGTRNRLSLDGAWAFRHDSGVEGEAQVPGPWQAQFPELRHAMGRGHYSRRFHAPELGAGEVAVLCFGAASDRAEVRLNGVPIGQHEGGWLPFEIVLPQGLLAAENLVEVECHLPESFEDFAEIPHGKQSWYGPIGGLWQSVALEIRARRHLGRVSIRSELSGQVSLHLTGEGAAQLRITDPVGRVVAEAQAELQGQTTVDLKVTAPRLWCPEDPALYALEVALPGDVTHHRFGFRHFEARNGQFFLNGKPYYMRAALDQDYYPDTICTPPSEAYLEDQFRKARELGLNMLRCHIKVPDPRYYEVADRMGLLVWTEIPNVAQLTEASARRLRETMEGILARDGNHPCIVIWTLINEDWGTRLSEDAAHRAWLAETFDWLKALDPTRLVVDNSPCQGNFHVKSDINDFHYYRSIPERRAEWDRLTEEFAAGADWTYSPHGDAQRRGDEPLVVSEFGVWGLPDPREVRIDGAEPWWMETGGTWGDGAAYPHGVEDRFRQLRLGRVFGSFRGFIDAVQDYQFRNLKYEIESIRARPSLQGYVITEFTDVHWESNGLLDMNRNPRRFAADFARVNADAVILPQASRHALWPDEGLEVTIGLASGGQDLPAGTLSWRAEGQSGQVASPAVKALDLATLRLPPLSFDGAAGGRMVRVAFRLEAAGKTLAEAHLDLALHLRPGALPLAAVDAPEDMRPHLAALGLRQAADAPLALRRILGPEDIVSMQNGRKIMCLPDSATGRSLRADPGRREPPDLVFTDGLPGLPAFPDAQLPNMSLVPRHGTMWRGDWIASFSWINRSGAFRRLPGGPMLDVSYDRVVPTHVLTGFRTWEFGGPVHSGLVVGWVHKPAALIAERQVGQGAVLVSTFRLFQDEPGADPVASSLLSALIETASRMQPGKARH